MPCEILLNFQIAFGVKSIFSWFNCFHFHEIEPQLNAHLECAVKPNPLICNQDRQYNHLKSEDAAPI